MFALSRSYILSLAALAGLAAADMLSVFIRSTLGPLLTPPELRGRVGAVERVFIGGSNELGAFESGMAAALVGAVPAVAIGGVLAIGAAAFWAWRFPQLRRIDRFEDAVELSRPAAGRRMTPTADRQRECQERAPEPARRHRDRQGERRWRAASCAEAAASACRRAARSPLAKTVIEDAEAERAAELLRDVEQARGRARVPGRDAGDPGRRERRERDADADAEDRERQRRCAGSRPCRPRARLSQASPSDCEDRARRSAPACCRSGARASARLRPIANITAVIGRNASPAWSAL